MALLSGLTYYQEEMGRLEQLPERWPDRQGLRDWLKVQYALLIGKSAEFDRLVDLDLKKREFVLTLQEPSLKPDRAREIKQELVKLETEIEPLRGGIRSQVAVAELRIPREQDVEAAAAVGLLALAIDNFSAARPPAGPAPSSTPVRGYTVTDRGSFALVAAPTGETYRCAPVIIEGPAVSIKCEPIQAPP
jgi:hypothetical protein